MKPIHHVLCFILVAFSTTTFATSNNFYISAKAGIFKADFNQTYLDQTDLIPLNVAQPALQHGYTGGLAIGYRHLFAENYFLGTELSGNIEGHSAPLQSGSSSTTFADTVQIKNHIDLTIVPGILVMNNVGLYMKLGLSRASLQDSVTSPVGLIPTTTVTNSNNNIVGFASGLGVEYWVNPCATIFAEGNYHDYGTTNFPDFQNFMATYTHAAHVYSYDMVVGASYKFNF